MAIPLAALWAQLPGLPTRIEEVSSSLSYVGYGGWGSPDESEAQWRIARILTQGDIIQIDWANDGRTDATWTDRVTYFDTVVLTNSLSTYLDGINDAVNFGDVFLFDRTLQFSFSFWLKPNNLAAQRCFYSKSTSDAAVNGINFQISTAGRIVLQARAGGAGPIYTGTTQAVVAGVWNHVVVTYDGSSNMNGFRVYINSAVDSTPSSSVLTGTWLLGQSAFVGARGGSAFYYVGHIDDVTVWSRQLSASEVLSIYTDSAGTPPTGYSFSADLDHWYRMGDADVFPTIDDNQGSANGTVLNTTASAFQLDTP